MPELPEDDPIARFAPIPPLLHSSEHDEPFHRCLACDCSLKVDGTGYIIEKAFKGDEVIFEHAICLSCRARLNEEFSVESRRRISRYCDEHADLTARRRKLLRESPPSLDPWIDRCLLTGRPRESLDEYLIAAQCDGGDLVFACMPILLSGEASETISELLSEETRDRLDRFVDEYLGLPPELRPFHLVLA